MSKKDYIELFKELDHQFKLYDVQPLNEKLLITVRTKSLKKYCYTISDFRPYFYVPKHKIKYHVPFIELNKCKKIVCNHPGSVKTEREKFQFTYEADILYDFRFHFDMLNQFNEDVDIEPRIWYIDIEVFNQYESSFPKPEEVDKFINSISIFDSYSEKFLTLVVAPNGIDCGKVVTEDKIVVKVKSEEILLKFFINLLNSVQPDFLVGWNILIFDIPFLVERIKIKYPDLYSQISPFNIEPKKKLNMIYNTSEYEIPGYIIFDYMLLYRKYGSKLGSYSLESVSQHELGEGKIIYETSLDELYEKNFNRFVQYNTEDVNLVRKLEDKLTFLQLIDQLKSITFCKIYTFNFNNTLKVGDMLIMKYIRKKEIPMVMKTKTELKTSSSKYSGAYVRRPKVGLYYDYIIDFDASSMYPSIIRSLNISPETLLCRIVEDSKLIIQLRKYFHNQQDSTFDNYHKTLNVVLYDGSIRNVKPKELKQFLYKTCKGNNFTIAINGSIFRTDKVGILKQIADDLALLREKNKNAKKVFGHLINHLT